MLELREWKRFSHAADRSIRKIVAKGILWLPAVDFRSPGVPLRIWDLFAWAGWSVCAYDGRYLGDCGRAKISPITKLNVRTCAYADAQSTWTTPQKRIMGPKLRCISVRQNSGKTSWWIVVEYEDLAFVNLAQSTGPTWR